MINGSSMAKKPTPATGKTKKPKPTAPKPTAPKPKASKPKDPKPKDPKPKEPPETTPPEPVAPETMAPPAVKAPPGGKDPLNILCVTSEARPFARTGGLADVCAALPRALAQLGHQVTVVLPKYR